ncbi:MAG: PAS domain S-box protein [Deltaproteobacteria bacterium]|nr:PAS domain S-box protein [Deltaproteobacteria bacterium]
MYNSSLKVLLIEDNPGDARLIRETLREINTTRYEMEWVDRLAPGLEQLEREVIDVVLLDLSLPDSHGLETLERTLPQSKEVPIVVLTGLDDEELAIYAVRNGAQDYLIKGDVNGTLLGRSIRYAIERKKTEVALQRAHDSLEERVRERTDAFVKQNKMLLKEIEEREYAEKLYQTLAEKSMAGVYIVQDRIFRYLNANAAAYAGYTPEELVGKEAHCIVHPEDRKLVRLKAGQMLKGERDAPYEFRIQTRDGRERWILETVASTVYEGTPAILGNSMDVTDMKKAEADVRESHQLLSNIISFLPNATLIIDQNGKVLAWNRAMEELTGVKAEDMVGLDNYEYAIPFYGERRPILIDLTLKSDGNIENKYSFLQRENDLLVAEIDAPCVRGEHRILWGKAAPIRDTNGETVGAIESIRDITGRKKAEKKLQESEETLRSIVENIGIGVSLISPDMEILALNKQMREWFPAIDITERPLCYRSFTDPPRDEICSFCPTQAALRDGEVHEAFTENPAGDTIRNYRIVASPVKDTNGTVTAAIEMVEDITENLELQEQRALSEKLYETVFETTGTGTVIVEDDTTMSLVNEEFARITGYSKEEIRGRSWTELIAEKDREMMKAYHRQRREDPHAAPSIYRCALIDRQGAEKHIIISVSMIPGTKRSVASFLDVSDQVKLQKQLIEQEKLYRLLADNVSDVIWTMDMNLRITYLSPSAANLFGYNIDEIPDILIEKILTTHSREIVVKVWKQFTEAVRRSDQQARLHEPRTVELELVRKDGSVISVETQMTYLPPSEKYPEAILGITRDITRRRQAEDERWETEHRYHILFDRSPMGVVHYDTDLRVIDCNEAATSILGATREHIIGFDLKSLEDRSVIPALSAPFEENEGVFEGRYRTTAIPTELWVSLRTAPLYSHEGTIDGGVAIMEDITDRIRAHQELEIKTRSLEEANTALRVLFDQVEKDRQEIQWNVLYNVKELIFPYIEKLRACRTDNERDTCLQVLKTNLDHIISPFLRHMTLTHYKLTPKELHVANLVKEGKTNKEIADLLHLSIRSVEFHRDNIREKLGLKKKKANLQSFLLSLR